MRATVQSGKTTDTVSQCLRVYPSAEQQTWMTQACRARQWAFNFGIRMHRSAWRDRFEQVSADPSCFTTLQRQPRPKWPSGNTVSRQITVFLDQVRSQETAWKTQAHWVERYHFKRSRQKKACPEQTIIGLSPVELKAAYTQDRGLAWVDRHPFAWLLDVPRSVLTQGVHAYQDVLTAKFADVKKPRRERLGRGWPKLKPLHECASFTVQLQRPATSKHLRAQWQAERVPLGPENLGGMRYRDDLALPQTIPSLITFKQSASGRWHASFAVKAKESRVFRNPARTVREVAQRVEAEALSIGWKTSDHGRTVAYDPNFAQTTVQDCHHLVMTILHPRQRREDRAQQARRDRRVAKTCRGVKPRPRQGHPGRQASNRSKKAQRSASRLREHGAAITQDFQKKVASVLGSFYARHHFEGTNHRALRKTKRKGNAFAWSDTAPGRQMDLIRHKAASTHEDALFVTCASSFPSSQRCWACHTLNRHVKDGRSLWTCRNPQCGMNHHRDECATRNLLDEGYRISPPHDSNSFSRNGVDAPCGTGRTTPAGGRTSANQNDPSFSPFEQDLLARLERNQVPFQVRRFTNLRDPDGTGNTSG